MGATVIPADSLKSLLSTEKFKRLWNCEDQFLAHSTANRWKADSIGKKGITFSEASLKLFQVPILKEPQSHTGSTSF